MQHCPARAAQRLAAAVLALCLVLALAVPHAHAAALQETHGIRMLDFSTSQILSIGNKAAREGDNSAYNANQAYHVLSQEIYSFTDADKAAPRPRRSQTQSRQAGSRKKQPSKGGLGLNPADMVKLLVPVVLIVVLVLVIRLLTPDKDPTDETVASIPTTAATTEATTAEAPSEETSAETVSYKTTDTLNVRKEPSTDADRIGKLDPGASVEYIRDHDDFWAVILYNDQEAYVAKQYLTAGE